MKRFIKSLSTVFCAAAMWSLSLAYRLTDDDGGRRYELEQCCVKV